MAWQDYTSVTVGGGPLFGNPPPKLIVGNYYRPYGYTPGSTGNSAAINDLFYTPLPIFENHTYQGAAIGNVGTAENGRKARLMVFNDDNPVGGPGTLAKDFGEVTANATAATLLASSSWAATKGNYYSCVWFKDAMFFQCMFPFLLVGGTTSADLQKIHNGHFLGNPAPVTGSHVFPYLFRGTAAYGAAPSTGVAITTYTGLTSLNSSGGSLFPTCDFMLKA